MPMIRSFAWADTEALFHSRSLARFRNIEGPARGKLRQMHAASDLASSVELDGAGKPPATIEWE